MNSVSISPILASMWYQRYDQGELSVTDRPAVRHTIFKGAVPPIVMTSNKLLPYIRESPVIAGVKSVASAKRAMELGIKIIFFLSGTIFHLKELMEELPGRSPLIFAHVDLLQGVGRDASGMQFLSRYIGVDGILTTRSHLARAAKKEGLFAIQRVFALDSEALKTGFSILRSSGLDAVEVLPALVLPHISHRLPKGNLLPIIAGGLVETVEEAKIVLDTPALAISTSQEQLWKEKALR